MNPLWQGFTGRGNKPETEEALISRHDAYTELISSSGTKETRQYFKSITNAFNSLAQSDHEALFHYWLMKKRSTRQAQATTQKSKTYAKMIEGCSYQVVDEGGKRCVK
jgi:hypothetical protein